LPVFLEFKLPRKQDVDVVGLMNLDAVGVRLCQPAASIPLGIEQIHLAGPPFCTS